MVRVVVVGNSYASYCQLPGLRWAERHGAPPVEVTAICARDMAKARTTAERFRIGVVTQDLAEALATAPDLVLISSPVDVHAAQVRATLAQTPPSTAILCEKPFTLDPHDARLLAADAHAQRRVALIDHQLRWSAPRRAFKALVDGGACGTPWVARTEMCFGSVERLTRASSWWDDASRGGGALQAIGSHLIDGLHWMLGPIVDAQARLTSCVRERLDARGVAQPVTADDHAELWMTHASGARSSLLCTTAQTYGRRSLLELIGSRGVLRLVDEDALTFARHGGAVETANVGLPSVEAVEACNDSAFARSEPLFLRDLLIALADPGGRAPSALLADAATFDDGAEVTRVIASATR